MVERKGENDSITFEKAGPQDAHLIACIDEAAHPSSKEENQLIGGLLKQGLLEEYEKNGTNYSFIAYKSGSPIGYMILKKVEDNEFFVDSWAILCLRAAGLRQ